MILKRHMLCLLLLIGCLIAILPTLAGDAPVVKRFDVVLMYQADQQTYADYGATVLAWGGQANVKVA